MSSVSKRE